MSPWKPESPEPNFSFEHTQDYDATNDYDETISENLNSAINSLLDFQTAELEEELSASRPERPVTRPERSDQLESSQARSSLAGSRPISIDANRPGPSTERSSASSYCQQQSRPQKRLTRQETTVQDDDEQSSDSGIYSRFSRRVTARGSCTGIVTVGPTKV